jgi:hypothetical protein
MNYNIEYFNDLLNKPKIIDCFIFYNELNMLEFRFQELYNDVNVLVKSTITSKDKILYYNENIDLFSKYKDKIIHIIVDDFPQQFIRCMFNEKISEELYKYHIFFSDVFNRVIYIYRN